MSKLLTFNEVIDITKIGRSQIYRKIGAGLFPEPVEVGPKTVRFRSEDIEEWISNLPARGLRKDAEQNKGVREASRTPDVTYDR